ncbi:MAG: DUF5671 domain-containing protein [Planctomycetota bacterium]|jgi:hypothetical protein
MDEKLTQFVDHARDKGMDHATIRQLLLSAGWKDKDIAEVFCTRELEIPIPEPAEAGPARARGVRRTGSVWPRRARDAFLHLLTFGALFTWATSLILLFFVYINFAFPDPAWRVSQSGLEEIFSVVRAQLATLIVSFPIFLVLWHFLLREVRRDPEKAKGAIRRWLAYLTLFVGAITLAADVMTLIYFLLEGQLTARFLLKAAMLFLIAGSLVLYLAFTLRSEADTTR